MSARPLSALALAAFLAGATPVQAAEAAASAPARLVSDIAHWQHPTKAVFAKYRLTLQLVTLQGAHATFRVAFPFDPQTQPNEATMAALYDDLLRANGGWGFTLESLQDGVAIDVSRDPRSHAIHTDSHRL